MASLGSFIKEEKKQDGQVIEQAALKTVDTSHSSLPQTPIDQNAPGSSSVQSIDEGTTQIQNSKSAAAFEEENTDKQAVMRSKFFKQQGEISQLMSDSLFWKTKVITLH